jgi:Tfp pilus assembly PilM family ATPase
MAISKLIFTGGSARLKGLLEYASNRLNVEVCMGGPILGDLSNLSTSQGPLSVEDVPLFSAAFGLAIKDMPGALKLAAA